MDFYKVTDPRYGYNVNPEAGPSSEIAVLGGRAVQAAGTAYRFTSAKAREAGRKGGLVAGARGTSHRFTSAEARAAGRKGGRKRVTP
jgi:hypothetical protein